MGDSSFRVVLGETFSGEESFADSMSSVKISMGSDKAACWFDLLFCLYLQKLLMAMDARLYVSKDSLLTILGRYKDVLMMRM